MRKREKKIKKDGVVSTKKGRLTIIFEKNIPRFRRIHQVFTSHRIELKTNKEGKETEKRKVVGVNPEVFSADKRFESFKNIKTEEAARKIISRRQGTIQIEKVFYEGKQLEI